MAFFEAVSGVFGAVMAPVLILSGIYFAFRLGWFYVLHPIRTLSLMTARRGDGISPVRAASMALAGTLGVGNITGVCAAIASGGAGAVFWMWISAFCAMSVKYAETALAVLHRRRGASGYYGGAPFYIKDGIGGRGGAALGGFFAVLCVVNSFTVGGILQVNAAADAVSETLGVSPVAVGIALAALTAAAVTGGAKRVSGLTVYMIPAVSALYIAMCAAVIAVCRDAVPAAFRAIFRDAFSPQAAAGGVGGYMFASAIRYGVVRGVITNEAGAGTSPTAHACADAHSPGAQGCLGIFEVFADTIVICTLTALAVLSAGGGRLVLWEDPMSTAAGAFVSVLGGGAAWALTAAVFVFVLATLLSQHYYANVALSYFGGSGRVSALFTASYIVMIVFGSVMSPPAVWLASDITAGLMTTVNVVILLLMRREVAPPPEIKSVAGNHAEARGKAASRRAYSGLDENPH